MPISTDAEDAGQFAVTASSLPSPFTSPSAIECGAQSVATATGGVRNGDATCAFSTSTQHGELGPTQRAVATSARPSPSRSPAASQYGLGTLAIDAGVAKVVESLGCTTYTGAGMPLLT